MSFFSSLSKQPGDPILGLVTEFQKDQRKEKVNLGVGAYRDSVGLPLLFTAVQTAEKRVVEANLNKEYQGICGSESFVEHTKKLLWGEGSPHLERIAGAQTVAGSGALRLGGELLARISANPIYLSNPSWPNHKPLFEKGGLTTASYSYYNPSTRSVNFDQVLESIEKIETGCSILLQACCHNPTGCDLTREQWHELSSVIKRKKLFPFFDIAYQGFDQSLEEDSYPIRYFTDQGHEMVVANSFSKNLGLYGERIGALTVVTESKERADVIFTHLSSLIRGNYSSPPLHSARVVNTIMESPELKTEWINELGNVRERIDQMRQMLVSELHAKGSERDFNFMLKQRGMFSYSALSEDQVNRLREEFAIYIVKSGRINIAGLNSRNIEYVAEAIVAVI